MHYKKPNLLSFDKRTVGSQEEFKRRKEICPSNDKNLIENEYGS